MASIGPGRARQGAIYLAGTLGRRPAVPTSWVGLQSAAERRMSARAAAYIAGGAGLERTAAANRDAFDRWQLVPRVLRDVSERDLTVELFGRWLPAPLLLAPVGAIELVHPEADLAVARAAARSGLPYILSNQASVPMEDVAAAMGDAPRWFQLYWSTSDDLVESFVRRADQAGCDAIVVTLDTTMLGWRPRDLDLGSLPFARGQGIAQYTSDPVFLSMVQERLASAAPSAAKPSLAELPAALASLASLTRRHPGRFWPNLRSPVPRAAVQTFLETYSRPSLTWDDLAFLRRVTSLPILLKGVQHPDDARRAVDEGVDGLVVSTHGGRQVDGAIGALDALPGVVDAVDGRMPVLFDSGVRSGADVLKALALGAQAVCVGRPYVYGLALAGSRGVAEVLDNLVAEADLTLGLVGSTSVGELSRDSLAER